MTRREAFGNCGLLGMLAALWPSGSGQARRPACYWRDVLIEAFALDGVSRENSVVVTRLMSRERMRLMVEPSHHHAGRVYQHEDGRELLCVADTAKASDHDRFVVRYAFMRAPDPFTVIGVTPSGAEVVRTEVTVFERVKMARMGA